MLENTEPVTFLRGWASAGRAIRLIQLMRLNDVDASAHTDEPRDFVESETKRRTFWIAFCLDRLICILEGLPLTLSEQTICTRLPSPENMFLSGTPVKMPFLPQALSASIEPSIRASPFVESILFTALWGRVFLHHQQSAAERVCGNVSAGAGQRQTLLEDLLSRHLSRFRESFPSATVEVNQMLLFTDMIAQTTVLALCREAELLAPDAAKYSDFILRYQWKASEAAQKLSCVAGHLSGFNLFQLGSVNRLRQGTQDAMVVDVDFSSTLQSSNEVVTLHDEDINMLEVADF
ncbi:hypothetical protein VPNG_07978 [Cytospora leucostoma]|uniref:Xylanolytic transcriptional activator regulatory domain-containing protein n=1 Tax=Cytospora leucostoma TaxID=1230097 RepID=A0A423WR77_9PEZI|nr:hypothetical protein VPNG_07978 [Cytospora leucostoma]